MDSPRLVAGQRQPRRARRALVWSSMTSVMRKRFGRPAQQPHLGIGDGKHARRHVRIEAGELTMVSTDSRGR